MRSVRLEPELESRLEEAARVTGHPVSRIIREAVRKQCDSLLQDRLDRRLADVVGSVAAGGSSRKTGSDFTRLVSSNARKEKKSRRERKR